MPMTRSIYLAVLLSFATSSLHSQTSPEQGFPALANEFVFTTLAFSPTSAMQSGLHRHVDKATGRTLLLDEMLDDFSPASMSRQRAFYEDFRKRLQALPAGTLDAQTQADYEILQNAVAFAFYTMDREQFHKWRPQIYPENLGSALFAPMSLEYADRNTRAQHLAARLEKVPAFIEQAIGNLDASNDVFRRVAIESMEGVAALVKTTGAEFVKGTPSEQRYARAQPAAHAAFERFNTFVRDDLPKRTQRDWRMGRERFAEKFRYYLQVSGTPEDLLRAAEDSLRSARRQMLALAEPLHREWFPGHRHAADDREAYTNSIVSEVMQRIGTEHAHRDSIVQQGQKDVENLSRVVVEKRLLSLTDFSNLRVIPTPPFMRGIYGVAGAVFAPALEPKLSTFYWVTPIDAEWNAERAESKMRE